MENLIRRWKNSRSNSISRNSPRDSLHLSQNSIEKPKKYSSSSSSSSIDYRSAKFRGKDSNLKNKSFENSTYEIETSKNLKKSNKSMIKNKKITKLNSDIDENKILDSNEFLEKIQILVSKSLDCEEKENNNYLEISHILDTQLQNINHRKGNQRGRTDLIQSFLIEISKPFRQEIITLKRKLNNSSILLIEKRKEIERKDEMNIKLEEKESYIQELLSENESLKMKLQESNPKNSEKKDFPPELFEIITMLKENQKNLEKTNKRLENELKENKERIKKQEEIWNDEMRQVMGIVNRILGEKEVETNNGNENGLSRSFGRLKIDLLETN